MSESIKKPAGCNAASIITNTGRIDNMDHPILQGTATCAGKVVQIEQVVGSFLSDEPKIQDNLNTLIAGLCLGAECPNFDHLQ
jgi:hypothetical protein